MLNNQSTNLLRYFKDIKDYKQLSKKQEINLYEKIKDGDEDALNDLIKSNLRYVITIANAYTNTGMDIENLISAGNVGLILAAKRFNPYKHNCKFLTYATFYIRRAMVTELSERLELIRIPGQVFTLKQKYKKVYYQIEQELVGRRSPNKDEILKKLQDEKIKITKSILEGYSSLLFRDYIYMDKNISDQDSLHDIIPDKKIELNTIENNQIRIILEKELSQLDPREQEILRKYYNFDDLDENITLAAIGKDLKLSRERIRQIKKRALISLKKRINKQKPI